MKRFWFFAYYIEIGLTARWDWTHFKIHRPTYRSHQGFYRHLVWGKLSLSVSQPQIETVRVCSHCLDEIQVVSFGDDCLDHCESCQQTEGDTHEVSLWDFEQGLN
jgi:hypothetical protein